MMLFAESEVVELKAEIVGDIFKEVVAFANTKRGALCTLGSAMMEAPWAWKMPTGSLISFLRRFKKGTDRLYYLSSKGLKQSRVYVRNETSSDPASDTAIRKMIKETAGDSFEAMRALEQTLSFEAAKRQFEKHSIPLDSTKIRPLE